MLNTETFFTCYLRIATVYLKHMTIYSIAILRRSNYKSCEDTIVVEAAGQDIDTFAMNSYTVVLKLVVLLVVLTVGHVGGQNDKKEVSVDWIVVEIGFRDVYLFNRLDQLSRKG